MQDLLCLVIYIWFVLFDFSSATASESDRLCYRIAMFSLLRWKFIFRIPGMVWSCKRLSYVSFFGLAGLQDSGMCAATGNDCDCREAIALGFCI